MIALLAAVAIASVLGSLHCVGMCGPLALWASGATQKQRGSQVWAKLTAYHFGRLLTYSIAGFSAGLVGSLISVGGSMVGVQSMAARLVGGAMIAMAIIKLCEIAFPKLMRKQTGLAVATNNEGGRIAGWIARRRPFIQRLPGLGRAAAAGSLTTLLPCGWLYLFVLVAAGTGGIVPAMSVMFAFWLGTLPALTALVAGSFGLATRLRPALPMLGSLILLATGLYTATGRAAADMSPLADRAAALRTGGADEVTVLQSLGEEPLPCCVPDAD